MHFVNLSRRVRRACHVDGIGMSAAVCLFGIDRKTVSKIPQHPMDRPQFAGGASC